MKLGQNHRGGNAREFSDHVCPRKRHLFQLSAMVLILRLNNGLLLIAPSTNTDTDVTGDTELR